MARRHIILGRESKVDGKPAYSSAVVAGDTIYLAGHGAGRDSEGNVVGRGDIEAQAVAMFDRMKETLEAAGGAFSDIVKMTVFTTNAADRAKIRAIRSRYVAQPPPASTSVIVTSLASPDMLVEIEAIAVIGGREGRPA